MIEIKDLTKRFDGFTALQELNMTVPQASVRPSRRISPVSRTI